MKLQHSTRERANDLAGCPPLLDLWPVQTNTERPPAHMLGKTRSHRDQRGGWGRVRVVGGRGDRGFSEVYRHVWSKVSPLGECLPSSASIHS